MLLGAAAVADAAFKAGTYRGKTKSDRRVSFTAGNADVTGFKIRAQYRCSDFDQFYVTEKRFPAMEIDEDGRFVGKLTNAEGSYKVTVKGALTGKRATGSYSAERTYNKNDELDPDGSITCRVRKLSWTAKRSS